MLEQIALALKCDTIDLFSTEKIKEANLNALKEKLCLDINELVEKCFNEL